MLKFRFIQQRDYFDLISSNGLTIYEADHEKVIKLFRKFYVALKPGGTLVTSTITPAPSSENDQLSEWDLTKISPQILHLQKIVFGEIIQAAWQISRSTQQIQAMLQEIGYINIQVLKDKAGMFPTIVARRPI